MLKVNKGNKSNINNKTAENSCKKKVAEVEIKSKSNNNSNKIKESKVIHIQKEVLIGKFFLAKKIKK
jgi:hypothetical protein